MNSDTAQIYVDLCTGIPSFTGEHSILILPNPSSGIFNIRCSEKIASFEVVNMLGEKIYSSVVNSSTAEINLSSEQNGMYFVHFILTERSKSDITKKISILK